jgi:hypothetical protein
VQGKIIKRWDDGNPYRVQFSTALKSGHQSTTMSAFELTFQPKKSNDG